MKENVYNNMNIIVRESIDSYPGTCKYLIDNYDFLDLNLSNESRKFASKKEIIRSQFRNIFFLIKSKRKFKNTNIVFSIGFQTITLVILRRIGLIRYKRIFWWGFFIHDYRYLRILKIILRILNEKRLCFLIFSEYEKMEYSKHLGINDSKFYYVPYGDWMQENRENSDIVAASDSDFYFSGGYSNRDYASLVKVFEGIEEKLVIVCSRNNKDIRGISLPQNVSVKYEISSHEFDEILRKSKAVIIPFKYDSGASGQSVMLRCMRNKKLVIVTETEVIKEYVDNEKSGFVINDIINDLPNVIEKIKIRPALREEYGQNLYDKYLNKFSYNVITWYLSNILDQA